MRPLRASDSASAQEWWIACDVKMKILYLKICNFEVTRSGDQILSLSCSQEMACRSTIED